MVGKVLVERLRGRVCNACKPYCAVKTDPRWDMLCSWNGCSGCTVVQRDTEGGWAGFTHTTGSQGFLSRIGQVAPGGTGAGAGLLLVALS